MKEVIFDYNFDLERTIKQSKKQGRLKRKKEAYISANYILDNFTKNNLDEDFKITKIDLQKAKEKIVETTKTTRTKLDGIKITTRKVVKYYIMTQKETFKILKQVTEYINTNGIKTINRTTSYLEEADLMNEKIILKNGNLNKKHPLVKKLIPKNTKKISGDIEH